MKPDRIFWKAMAEEWRKPLFYALLVYLVFIPVAYAVALVAPGRKSFPFWGYVAVMHALMCALVAVICNTTISITTAWMPRARLNHYASQIRNFDAALALWPFIIAVIMIILKSSEHT